MSVPVDYELLSAKNAIREVSRQARPKISAPEMRYTAQAHLDGANIAEGLSKLQEWLEDRRIEPSTFRYRMEADDVRLQIDFATLEDAAAFAEAFGGSVSGGTQAVH